MITLRLIPRLISRLLPCLLIPGTLLAQVPARDSIYEVAPLVITAERQALPAAAVSGTVTVLLGDELRLRGVRSVAEALSQVPGAAVVGTGSFGGQTSLFLRGGESDYVKVLVDGVAMNQPGGAFDFGALTIDDVERIEVVRGPASVLYGTDAVTGVVQIFTRTGRGALRLDAAVRGGSFDTRRGEITASAGTGRLSWSAGLSDERTDGTYAFNSDWKNTVATGRVGYRVTDRTSARATLRLADDDFHFPTLSDGTPGDSNTANLRQSAALSLGLDHQLDPAIRLTVTGALSAEGIERTNDRDSPGDTLGYGFASRAEVEVLHRAVEARMILAPSERWSLTYGAEYLLDQEERLQGYAVSDFGFGQDSSVSPRTFHNRQNIGTYVQLLLEPSQAWSFSGGARMDDNEAFGQFITTRAGMVRRFGEAFRLRASAGTGFKTPTLEETYGNSAFSKGDPDLDPERSFSWEVGGERTFQDGRLLLSAVWFDQRFKDLVQYGFVAPGAPTYYNVAAATSRGLELTLRARPTPRLLLDGGYTYLQTEVTDPGFNAGDGDVFVQGEELIRRPAHTGRIGASWTTGGRAVVGGELSYVGERTDVDFGPFPSVRKELPAYTLVGLHADIEVLRSGLTRRPTLALTFKVDNLLDKEYETVVGFPGRGRALYAGVRSHW